MTIHEIAWQMNLHSNITPNSGVWDSNRLQPCIAPKNKRIVSSGAIFGKHYMVFCNKNKDYLMFDSFCFLVV